MQYQVNLIDDNDTHYSWGYADPAKAADRVKQLKDMCPDWSVWIEELDVDEC